jgi:hypothetical protein
MKSRALWIVLLLAAAACLPSSAAPLCTTFTTMSQLTAQGATGCEFGGFLFYNFSYTDTPSVGSVTSPTASSGSAPQITASHVLVAWNGSDPSRIGMTLTVDSASGGSWSATGAGSNNSTLASQSAASSQDVRLNFSVLSLDAPNTKIAGAGLGLTGAATWDYGSSILANRQGQFRSLVTAGETLTPTAPVGPTITPQATFAPTNPGANVSTLFNLSTVTPFDIPDVPIVQLANVSTSANIAKDIAILSGKGSANTASLTQIDEVLYVSRAVIPTPEPGTWAIAGAGLLVVSLVGRRRKREFPAAPQTEDGRPAR